MGVKTTIPVKRIGCSNLKDLIEKDKLIIEDFDTIQELYNFISNGKVYEADEGYNDDLVMSLVIFAWATGQSYFREMMNVNIRDKLFAQQIEVLEDQVTPFGIIDDGQEEETIVDEKGQVWHIDRNQEDDIFGGNWASSTNVW